MNNKCSECFHPFNSQNELEEHERIHSEEIPFKCGKCDKRFAMASDLKTHERTHAGKEEKNATTENKILLSCVECDENFEKFNDLRNHKKKHESKNHENKLKCSSCSKEVKKKKHVKAQNSEKPFNCADCENKYTRNLKIASLNIRGNLSSEKDLLLKHLIHDGDYDVFNICETEIKDFDESRPYSVEGYRTFFPIQRPGTTTKHLLCLVKENLEAVQRTDLMSELLSTVWIELKGPSQKVLVCGIYIEFNDLSGKGQMSEKEQIERWEIFRKQVDKASKEGLILAIGDQNIDVERLEEPSYYLYNLGKEYQNLIAENGLETIHYGITRRLNQDTKSAIDHAFCNKPISVQNWSKKLIDPTISDHDLIDVELDVSVPKKLQNGYTTFRDYRKVRANPDFFITQLNKIDWNVMKNMDKIDDMEAFFTEEVTKCLDVCAEWKTKKLRSKKYRLPEAHIELQSPASEFHLLSHLAHGTFLPSGPLIS